MFTTANCSRLTFFFLTAVFLTVCAEGFSQNVTFTGNSVPLKTVFAAVEKQTGFLFLYPESTLRSSRPVTISVKDLPVSDFLQAVFRSQPLDYTIKGKSIFISPGTSIGPSHDTQPPRADDPVPVAGAVRDQDGKPVSGASIIVKGSQNGVSAGPDGTFTINAKIGDVLNISSVGYSTTQIRLTADNIANPQGLTIVLPKSSVALEEVQINLSTGYQSIARERSAGSFSKPDMNIVKNRTGTMNVLQRLDGLVAGLTVNNAPSARQSPFLIRGLSTIGIPNTSSETNDAYVGTNRNPLYVVDGLPLNDVSSVNPQDVADITVLKDATAASIWGARASNGVIVITTKKGVKGDRTRVNYDAFFTLQGKPDLDNLRTLNSRQFIDAATGLFDPVVNPWEDVTAYQFMNTGIAPHELILYNKSRGLITDQQAAASLDSLAGISNRKQIKDLWYRNASLMTHTIALTGGTGNYAFYGSAAYTNTTSNRPGDKDNSYRLNLRQDMSLGGRIQLNLITNLTNNIGSAKRNVSINNNFYPYQLFRDAGGHNISMPYMQYLAEDSRLDFQNRSGINLDYNPLDEVNDGYTKNNSLFSRNILGVSVNILKALRFEGSYGYNKGSGSTEMYDDERSYKVRSEVVQYTVAPTAGDAPIYYLPNTGGAYSVSNISQQDWTVRNQLSYNNSWKQDLHQLTILVGQEAQQQLTITNGSKVRGYNDMLQTYVPVDYATLSINGVYDVVMPNSYSGSFFNTDYFSRSENRTRFTSYYANLAYTYDRKYSINASLRRDRSNLFGLDKSAQNKPVWSVGGKWQLGQEKFLAPAAWLNSLALRVTYGLTGNSPSPGTVASFDIIQAGQSSFLPGGTGFTIVTPSNSKLTWESTKTINIGLDFAVFESRINGSLDFYQKKTTDLLGNLAVNTFTGYANITGNLGDLQNRGIELSLNTLNVQSGHFRWSSLLRIAYNKNLITKLNSTYPVTMANDRINQNYVAGYPAFAVFAYRYAGLDAVGDPQILLADKTVTKTPYVAKPEDLRFMGTYQPVWNGGFSNIFTYGNLSLSANAVFSLGHVMRKDVTRNFSGRFTHLVQDGTGMGFQTGNKLADFDDRWRKPGDEAHTNVPAFETNSAISLSRRDVLYYAQGDLNVVSASYIKMRDITLAYDLPAAWLRRVKADQLTFRIQVSNLMLWKANKDGIDPEFQEAAAGIRGLLVNQRTLSAGLNIKF